MLETIYIKSKFETVNPPVENDHKHIVFNYSLAKNCIRKKQKNKQNQLPSLLVALQSKSRQRSNSHRYSSKKQISFINKTYIQLPLENHNTSIIKLIVINYKAITFKQIVILLPRQRYLVVHQTPLLATQFSRVFFRRQNRNKVADSYS